MAKTTTAITADGTHLIGTIAQKQKWENNQIGVHVHGAFGGGTVTFSYSLDSGTTKAVLREGAGTAGTQVSYTASGGFVWDSPLTTGGSSPILLYAVVTGSTAATITAYVVDQNNG